MELTLYSCTVAEEGKRTKKGGNCRQTPGAFVSQKLTHRLDGASPAVGRSGLFFCDEDGYFYRLDAHTGEQLWKMRLPVMDTPTIASDGTVYLALVNQSTVLAMHPNGSIQWTLVSGKGGRAL